MSSSSSSPDESESTASSGFLKLSTVSQNCMRRERFRRSMNSMKYDSEVGVVRTSRRLSLLVVDVSDWTGFCRGSVRPDNLNVLHHPHRVILATQNNNALFDFLLGGIQAIKVRNNVFCLLAIDPIVFLVVRWAYSSVKTTRWAPAEEHRTQKHPGAPNLSHNIVLESSRIKERCTTADASKERLELSDIRANGDRLRRGGPCPWQLRVGIGRNLCLQDIPNLRN